MGKGGRGGGAVIRLMHGITDLFFYFKLRALLVVCIYNIFPIFEAVIVVSICRGRSKLPEYCLCWQKQKTRKKQGPGILN